MEKLAIIELADTSLKLMILKTRAGHYKVIEEVVEPLKIAEEIEAAGLIKPKSIGDAITVLKLFRKLSENYGVTKTIAVAYKILEKARNQKSFLEEVYNNTGINFVVLGLEDEIKTLYNGVMSRIDVSKGYILDIGNRTTSIIKFNRRNVLSYHTIDVGAISLAEKYGEDRDFKAMETEVGALLKEIDFQDVIEPETMFIGAGATFISLGRLSKKVLKYSLELENNYRLSKEHFEDVYSFTKTLDIDKTKKLKGISDERADSLLSGFAILKALIERFTADEITVTTACFKDGLIATNVSSEANEKFNDMLGSNLENFREFAGFECENHAQVYNLAIILFKQLKVMHKLPRYYVKPLRIAASMYDTGKYVDNDNYSKHGFYTILNAGICGATQKEILIAAFICACQNLDNLNLTEWMRYKDLLTEEDLDAVRKLGVIVRLAAALDVSRKSVVEDVSCDILGDSVIMKTIVRSDPTFEIREGMKVAADYKKVFRKYLQII